MCIDHTHTDTARLYTTMLSISSDTALLHDHRFPHFCWSSSWARAKHLEPWQFTSQFTAPTSPGDLPGDLSVSPGEFPTGHSDSAIERRVFRCDPFLQVLRVRGQLPLKSLSCGHSRSNMLSCVHQVCLFGALKLYSSSGLQQARWDAEFDVPCVGPSMGRFFC